MMTTIGFVSGVMLALGVGIALDPSFKLGFVAAFLCVLGAGGLGALLGEIAERN